MNTELFIFLAALACAGALIPTAYSSAQTFVEAEGFKEVGQSPALPGEARIEEGEEWQQQDRARLDDAQDPAADEATAQPGQQSTTEQQQKRGVNWERTRKNAGEITEGVPVGRIDLDKVRKNTADALGRPK